MANHERAQGEVQVQLLHQGRKYGVIRWLEVLGELHPLINLKKKNEKRSMIKISEKLPLLLGVHQKDRDQLMDRYERRIWPECDHP